jgi:cytochrome c biogenesis protein CcmG, thiol:disulfide interchange protein DsbE
MNRQTGMRSKAAAALAAALALTALAACGSGDSSSADSGAAADAPSFDPALADAPPKLERLYADGSALIEGGEAAYDETLASVRGYPVVVNHWGSWCGPCREEFPHFQQQAAEHLDEVAFLGIDTEDSPDAYATFLEEHPIPYPSVADPDGEFASWAGVGLLGQPNTLFYDREGELVFTHQGPYTDEDALAADIEKYALSS